MVDNVFRIYDFATLWNNVPEGARALARSVYAALCEPRRSLSVSGELGSGYILVIFTCDIVTPSSDMLFFLGAIAETNILEFFSSTLHSLTI